MRLEAFARRLFHATGALEARPYITMFDDVTVSVLPTGGAYAYAGYVGGLFPTFPVLQGMFPHNRLLSIAVFASQDAECLDVERGDATNGQVPAWFERQVARGVFRPVIYTSASNAKSLEKVMAAHGVPRSAYRLWTAHYTKKAHLCGPKSCGFGMSQADGTQWTDQAFGLNLDRSLLVPEFFDPRPAPKPVPVPTTNWQEKMMNDLPTLKQGDEDKPGRVFYVTRAKALTRAIGIINDLPKAKVLPVDGVYDDTTHAAVAEVQRMFGLAADGVTGPKTWAALVTGAH